MVRGNELGEDFVRTYPELSVDRLKVELNMFRSEHGRLENMTDLVEVLSVPQPPPSYHTAYGCLTRAPLGGGVIHSPFRVFS